MKKPNTVFVENILKVLQDSDAKSDAQIKAELRTLLDKDINVATYAPQYPFTTGPKIQ